MNESVAIEVGQLVKEFGSVTAVNRIDLRFEPGLLYVLLGPSGCGKTTTLRIIAGLEAPSAGQVKIAGEDVTDVPVFERDLGFVFQQYALFPHMNVAANIGFGLRMRRLPRARIHQLVADSLALVQLSGLEERMPRQLSGGQQQRVALARALVTQPRALLLDEPLSNLDKNLRDEMRSQIRSIQRRLGITTIMVTHDQTEALELADRVVVMNKGNIEQVGTAEEIFRRPSSLFTAHFVGAANVIAGNLTGDGVLVDDAGLRFPVPDAWRHRSGAAALVIRPADLTVAAPSGGSAKAALTGAIKDSAYQGSTRRHSVILSNGRELSVDVSDRAAVPGEPGAAVVVSYDPEHAHILAGRQANG